LTRDSQKSFERWDERDAFVEQHRGDFVLWFMCVRANDENSFNSRKRLRAAEAVAGR
jgi:hypothetical protein